MLEIIGGALILIGGGGLAIWLASVDRQINKSNWPEVKK